MNLLGLTELLGVNKKITSNKLIAGCLYLTELKLRLLCEPQEDLVWLAVILGCVRKQRPSQGSLQTELHCLT